MNWKRVTEPTLDPFTLEEAKDHVRVELDTTADDSELRLLIGAVVSQFEEDSRHALLTQTWELYLDEWPAGDHVELPRPPLQSIESVTYQLEDGSTETLSTDVYLADVKHKPGRLVLKPNQDWPSDTLYPASSGPITVQYKAGWTAVPNIPKRMRQAMLLLLGVWFAHREDTELGQGSNVAQLPLGYKSIAGMYAKEAWISGWGDE